MQNNKPPFDNDISNDNYTGEEPSLLVKESDDEPSGTEDISPLTNYYLPSGEKKITKDLKKLVAADAKRQTIIINILSEAQTTYTVDYVKLLIKLSRYFFDLELSEETENRYIENIRDLRTYKFGEKRQRIEEIVETIESIHELEERLEKKGYMKKKSAIKVVVNRIARKEGDSI